MTDYLANVPDDLLLPKRDGLARLIRYLDNRRLPRPTLMQLEQERARRGMRRLPQ